MDITDVAQLAIFIHGVDETLTVTEEFLELVPVMDATTANDIFNCCRSARQGRSGLGPCCQPGYRWRAINDRDITWILQSIWIIWRRHCKAAKKLSHSIMTAYMRSSWSLLCGRHNFQVVTLLVCVRPELMLTWLGTKIRSQDCCRSLSNGFRFLVNLRQISRFFARHSQSMPRLPVNIQLEIIDLQCDSDLRDKFVSAETGCYSGYDTWYWCMCEG